MKAATREWIEKAEDDYLAATALARLRKKPLHDQVCFHCQQSAEKYFKGRLEEARIPFPKTHDLEVLLNLALAVEPLWSAMAAAMRRLKPFGVLLHYPGNEATAAQARQCVLDCKTIRREARLALGL